MGLFTPAFQPVAILDLCRTGTAACVAGDLRRDFQLRSAAHTRDRDTHGARRDLPASHPDGPSLRHAAGRGWRGAGLDSQCAVGPGARQAGVEALDFRPLFVCGRLGAGGSRRTVSLFLARPRRGPHRPDVGPARGMSGEPIRPYDVTGDSTAGNRGNCTFRFARNGWRFAVWGLPSERGSRLPAFGDGPFSGRVDAPAGWIF